MLAVKKHSLLLFFVLAYVLTWAVWFTSVAQASGALSFHIPNTLGYVGLAAAAYLAAVWSGGLPAVIDLLRRMIRWRANPLWYGVALLLMGAICYLTIAIGTLFGLQSQIGALFPLSGLVPFILSEFALFLFTEETAWRGFALPRLQGRFNALNASLILGLFWGLWHIPLFMIPGSFQQSMPFAGFVLSAIATSVFTTWIFNHSHGSILIAAIFHATTDAFIAFSGVMSSGNTLFWLFVLVLWLVALVVILVEGPQYLSRKGWDPQAVIAPGNEVAVATKHSIQTEE